jgi:hypothetical protein
MLGRFSDLRDMVALMFEVDVVKMMVDTAVSIAKSRHNTCATDSRGWDRTRRRDVLTNWKSSSDTPLLLSRQLNEGFLCLATVYFRIP